ncbi:MAG: DUF4838 domain-containing protein [bacterium]|nr:DUF4838 domain-containing protein [bacterium]
MKFHVSLLIGVCAVLLPLTSGAAELAFDSESLPEPVAWNLADWTIVSAPDALPSEQYAAREFQQYFKEYTGVELPIEAAPPKPTHNVYVGPSAAVGFSSAAVLWNDLGEEGLRIRIEPDNIAIVGGRPRGTLYGVYEFLERYLGVRFLTFDHTHVPQPQETVTIPCEEFSFTPTFSFRWSYYAENMRNHGFAARGRCNTVPGSERLGGVTRQRLIGHSYPRLIPLSEFSESHPEYFALHNGQQPCTNRYGCQVCNTNPDVRRICTERTLAEFRANPSLKNAVVSIADNHDYCECPECAAIDEREESHAGANLDIVNHVAAAVTKEFPGKMVGTLAYYHTRKPPKHMKPLPNVQFQLCSIECSMVSPLEDRSVPINREFCDDLIGWGKISEQIWIWNYNTNFHYYDMPCPNLRVIGPNVRLFARNNVKGVFMQANGNGHSGEFSDLRNYVISRTLWHPECDSWELVEEFCKLHYKESAEPILEWLEYSHDRVEALDYEPNCFGDPYQFGLDKEAADVAMDCFDRALAAAPDDAVKARVEKASICALRLVLTVSGEAAVKDGGFQLVYPERYSGVFDRYKELCTTYDVARGAEHWQRDTFINLIDRLLKACPVAVLENDTWRLVVVPEANARTVRILHKPSGTEMLPQSDRDFYVKYDREPTGFPGAGSVEEWALDGLPRQVAGFDVQTEGSSATFTKTFEDGTVLTRTIALEDEAIRFGTALQYKGKEPKMFRLMFHPEWNVATGKEEPKVVRAYAKEDGKWSWLRDGWGQRPESRSLYLDDGRDGAVAVFNKRHGFGIRQQYDPADLTPGFWWGYKAGHLNLELKTAAKTLKAGETMGYEVVCEFIDAEPK